MLHRIKHRVISFLPALRSRNYRLYFFGQGISLVGTWMAAIAEQWLIYPVLTKNQSLLGITSVINLVPTVVLVLFAGVFADRINRRNSLIVTQTLFMFISFVLSYLVFSGLIQVWHVMLAAFIAGIVFAFDMPIRQSFMVELVDKPDVASAMSLNSGIFNAARAIGPAMAGFLIATIGIAPAYLLNGVSFLAVIFSILFMTLPPHVQQEHPSYKEGFKEGFRYLLTNKIVGVLLLLVGLLTFSTWPAATLLPVFAHDIFKMGETGFGLLQGSFGFGAAIGAFGFAKFYEAINNKFYLIFTLIGIIAVSMILFAFTSSFWLALVWQVTAAWGASTLIGTVSTLIITNVPTNLRGRLMSYYSFVLIGGMPPGAILASIGVATIGARYTVISGAIFFVLASFLLIASTRGKFQEKISLIQ